jgi:hypothetical protein
LLLNWLGSATIAQGALSYHLTHFGGLDGFSKQVRLSMNIIWLSTVWTIWRERNESLFQQKEEQPRMLCEKN